MDRQRVKRTIATLCDLREAQAQAQKCMSRADRSLDLKAAYTQRAVLAKRCSLLEQRLRRLESPTACRPTRMRVERNFDQGRLATRMEAAESTGVATVGPGWHVAASRIVDFAAVRRVLDYLERQKAWRDAQLRSSPHPAIPRFVSTSEEHACLQNLPAWQSSRLTLLACLMWRRKKPVASSELTRWVRSLGVHEAYVPALRRLRSILQTKSSHLSN